MAVQVKHRLAAVTPDDPAYEIRPSHWNDTHAVTGTPTLVPFFDPTTGELTEDARLAFDATGKRLHAGAEVWIDNGAGVEYHAKIVAGRWVLADAAGNPLANLTLDTGTGGGSHRFYGGVNYGYLGIQSAAPGNELALFASNTSVADGSSAGGYVTHQAAAHGFTYYDFMRIDGGGNIAAGWRYRCDQDDVDALWLQKIGFGGSLTRLFRYSATGFEVLRGTVRVISSALYNIGFVHLGGAGSYNASVGYLEPGIVTGAIDGFGLLLTNDGTAATVAWDSTGLYMNAGKRLGFAKVDVLGSRTLGPGWAYDGVDNVQFGEEAAEPVLDQDVASGKTRLKGALFPGVENGGARQTGVSLVAGLVDPIDADGEDGQWKLANGKLWFRSAGHWTELVRSTGFSQGDAILACQVFS